MSKKVDLGSTDPAILKLIQAENKRQANGLQMIPSENHVSAAVLEALSSRFSDKYAEGYPGKRYYGGQQNTDKLEQLAIARAKRLFNAGHANVQVLSGAPANLAVYSAWLEPGDTVMAMELSHGGHLTHGAPATLPAKLYKFVRYGMANLETGEIDFDKLREQAMQCRPKIIIAGHSSYPRHLDWTKFATIAKEVDAVAMADIAHLSGLIAGGVMENPLQLGFQVATTTTQKTLRGPRSGMVLSQGTVGSPFKPVEKKLKNLPTLIDRAVFPGLQGGPHMNTIAAVAVALQEASTPDFKIYTRTVLDNAQALAKDLMQQGCKLITGGTDNHLILIDAVSSFKISGAEAQTALEYAGITVNKNVIPNDTRPAYDPSGIRLGTPAITTRGMKEPQMRQIATWITQAIEAHNDKLTLKKIAIEVQKLCHQFPLPT